MYLGSYITVSVLPFDDPLDCQTWKESVTEPAWPDNDWTSADGLTRVTFG